MDETRTLFGMAMAVGGALLLAAVALLIVWVLDLPAAVAALLVAVGLVAGAWYGWRLPKGLKSRGSRPNSGHGRG